MEVPAGKKVILRMDLDVKTDDDLRLTSSKDTLEYLIKQGCKIVIIGHMGRPEGKVNNEFSLEPVSKMLSKVINKEIKFVFDVVGAEAQEEAGKLQPGEMLMLENLRFDSREEENDESFAKSISSLGDFYVNEAFGVSHRKHASIVGVPKFLPHCLGIRFEKEIENLSRDFDKPTVFLLSGFKKDKLDYLEAIKKFADKILIAGRLPDYMGDKALESVRLQPESAQVVIGNLVMGKEDISLNTIERFKKEIEKAKTVIVSGPMGKFEDEGHRQGTIGVLKAVVDNKNAFKIAGGGDTENVLKTLSIARDFDWVSVGGGAMLEFLTKKTLPAIEAMKD